MRPSILPFGSASDRGEPISPVARQVVQLIIQGLQGAIGQPVTPTPAMPPAPEQARVAEPEAASDLVTLLQAATLVKRRKGTLRHYRDLPPPTHPSRQSGHPHLWEWSVLRPWLEQKFGRTLPERFPHL
jgi:hypothetical protein